MESAINERNGQAECDRDPGDQNRAVRLGSEFDGLLIDARGRIFSHLVERLSSVGQFGGNALSH
jgi:hypothetical protein